MARLAGRGGLVGEDAQVVIVDGVREAAEVGAALDVSAIRARQVATAISSSASRAGTNGFR